MGWQLGALLRSPPERRDVVVCGPSSSDGDGQAGQRHVRFILPSWRDVKMNSNPLSELAFQGEVIQITRAYLFLCNSEQTQHEKKEIGSTAEEREGRGHGHNRDSSRKYFCKEFIPLKTCVLANSKQLTKFGSWWY